MPTENTRGEKEIEKLRRLNANLFFLKAFFVKHNLSYEYDYFLEHPTNSKIFEKLIEGSPAKAQEKVAQILREYQELQGVEKKIIAAGLPYLGWDPRHTPEKVKHRADVIKVLPKPGYLTTDDRNTINNMLEIPEILKQATGYSIWIQIDPRGEGELEQMRMMFAELHFLKTFFTQRNQSIAFEDFLKNPSDTVASEKLKQHSATDIQQEISRILDKYKALTPSKREIIQAGLPHLEYLLRDWAIRSLSQRPPFDEVRIIFKKPEYLLHLYNQIETIDKVFKEKQRQEEQRQQRQRNLREICANLNFLRTPFLHQGIEATFEAFLKKPLDIANYNVLESELRSIFLGVEPLLKRLQEYRSLAMTSPWNKSVVIAAVHYLKDNTMPTDPNLQDAVTELKLGEPSFLQLHLPMINEHKTAVQKEAAVVDSEKLRAAEEKRKQEEIRVQQAQEAQRLREGQLRQKAESQRQAQSREQEERQRKAYEAQRLQQKIEAQQQRVVEIAKNPDKLKTIYALLYDIHKKCQSDPNYNYAQKFWNDPKNPDNFSLMQDIITRKISRDKAPVNMKALKYYQELATVVQHLSSNPNARTADELQVLALLRPIKDSAYKYATGSLDAKIISETHLLILAKQAKKKAKTKARDKKESEEITNSLQHYNLKRYWDTHGNLAQRFGSYDKTRKKQIDFIVDLQSSLSTESDMKPAKKAAILHSALTLLLQELQGEIRATRWLGTKSRLETIIEQELEKLGNLDFFRRDSSHQELFKYVKGKDKFNEGPNLERLKKFQQLNETSHPKPKHK